jgi:hypothetical protein
MRVITLVLALALAAGAAPPAVAARAAAVAARAAAVAEGRAAAAPPATLCALATQYAVKLPSLCGGEGATATPESGLTATPESGDAPAADPPTPLPPSNPWTLVYARSAPAPPDAPPSKAERGMARRDVIAAAAIAVAMTAFCTVLICLTARKQRSGRWM